MTRGRIAFVYDHLHPYTVGGAERWYAAIAGELAREQPVTYLTRTFWEGEPPERADGVELIGLAPAREQPPGFVRRNAAKARFCLALAAHLARRGGRYDVVHCCSFPQAAVLAAALGLVPHRRTRLVGDWHEVLSGEDWRGRLGRKGELGRMVQRLAIRAGDAAVTFSRLHERRLASEGRRSGVVVIPEFPTDPRLPAQAGPAGRENTILFVGRLVPQKRAHLLPLVLAELRRRDASWHGLVFGDGPEADHVAGTAAAAGVGGAVRLAGFVGWEQLSEAMLRARALVLPTTREGFGLVVLEAAAHGLPSVLVDEPDNAAVELIEPGRNGIVCRDAHPETLASAVLELAADPAVHDRTRAWFEGVRDRHSATTAAAELRALHARLLDRDEPGPV